MAPNFCNIKFSQKCDFSVKVIFFVKVNFVIPYQIIKTLS